jgi:PBSX family phage portal protein
MSDNSIQSNVEINDLPVETTDGNRMVLKAIKVNSQKEASGERGITRQLPEDSFKHDYSQDVIAPPFDLFVLATLEESSSVMRPCLDAMAINIDSLGHRIVARDKISRSNDELPTEVENEISKVDNFFSNSCLEYTFTTFRDRVRRDYESTGNAYMEVIPSFVDPSEPAGLNHLPSWTMRLAHVDKEQTYCEIPRSIRVSKDKWEIKLFPYRKQFRRYVQRKDSNGKKVYFKEWNDPRVISYETGEVLADSWQSATPEQRQMAANPVIHLKLYSPRSPYGLPRFIGNLFTLYGSREAEKINYTTLKCNNIPALMMLVTNAQLTSGSIKRIKEFVEERVQGDNNYSTMLIVEAEPISEGMKDPGTMKMELKPLNESQTTDAMFVNYMDRNDNKIRQAFRIPPIFIGSTDDYTRATADSSRKLAEEQVFYPERQNFDGIMNTTIVPALGAASALFRTNTPNVTDNYELTQLLAVAERSGGLSPHISRIVVEDVLGRDLPEVDENINPHIPFTLTMLREQLKAQLDENGDVEKYLSDDEVIKQLRVIKGMLTQSSSVSEDDLHSLSSLITTLEAANFSDVPQLAQPNKSKNEVTKDVPEKDEQLCISEESNLLPAQKQYRPVFKSDDDLRIIGGAVLVPGTVDLQGEIYDDMTVQDAAHHWLLHYGDSIDNGIKLMHDGVVIGNAARPIESYVLQDEKTFELELSAADDEHPAKEYKTITYPKGTWMLYAKILDDDLWDSVKKGELLGWSIGGIALVQELKNYRSK